MTEKMSQSKFLARKFYNILPPSMIYLFGGMIAFGLTLFDVTVLQGVSDVAMRAELITLIGIMWLVFFLGLAIHLTLWTDVEADNGV